MDEKIIKIWSEDFAIVKSKSFYDSAFANINDGREITVIIGQNNIKGEDIISIERGYKLITFDTILNFDLIGFISKISSALAEAKISIFVISSYSTDHILVKKKDLNKAIEILNNLKIIIK